MRIPPPLVVLALAAACASAPPPRAFVHPQFPARRPATVALTLEGGGDVSATLRAAVNRGLIEKDYSVLAPGEPPGPGMGEVIVTVTAGTPSIAAVILMRDDRKDRLYRAEARADTPEDLAERLLTLLPRK